MSVPSAQISSEKRLFPVSCLEPVNSRRTSRRHHQSRGQDAQHGRRIFDYFRPETPPIQLRHPQELSRLHQDLQQSARGKGQLHHGTGAVQIVWVSSLFVENDEAVAVWQCGSGKWQVATCHKIAITYIKMMY